MGHPRPPQDRPHRLPLAHPPVHRPRRRNPLRPQQPSPRRRPHHQQAHSFDTPGAEFDHRHGRCTFEVLIDHYRLDDPALVRLAAIVHAADIVSDLNTDPLGPGLLAIGQGGLDVEPDDHRLLDRAEFVYDALYAWCAQQLATTPP